MGNLLAYSGTATKIRGMRRKLLTAKDFQHLASLTSVSEAIGFLKTKSAYSKIFKDSDETSLHRGEIEKIRGVSADNMIRILLDRNFIKEVGRKDVPGRPIQFGTTKEFLKFFHLNSISELPRLDENEEQRFELAR